MGKLVRENNMDGYYMEQANRLYLSKRSDGFGGIAPIWERCCDDLLGWYSRREMEELESSSKGYRIERLPEDWNIFQEMEDFFQNWNWD